MSARAFRCTGCGGINRVAEGRSGTPKCGRCKLLLNLAGAPQDVSQEELERTVEASPIPVLVDFWAPWCGPCRAAAPLVERVARDHAGKLIVLKLNSDDYPALGAKHGIRGIPAFVMFKAGREAGRQVGLPGPAEFSRWVEATAG